MSEMTFHMRPRPPRLLADCVDTTLSAFGTQFRYWCRCLRWAVTRLVLAAMVIGTLAGAWYLQYTHYFERRSASFSSSAPPSPAVGLFDRSAPTGPSSAHSFANQWSIYHIISTLGLMIALGYAAVLYRRRRRVLDEMQGTIHSLAQQLSVVCVRDKERRDLVANVTHDLLKPVSSMRAYLETMLIDKSALDPDTIERYLKTALKNNDALDRLVSDF